MESKPAPDPIYVLRGSSAAVNVIKFAPCHVQPDGLLVSGSSKGIISLWNLKTKRPGLTLDGHQGQGILNVDVLSSGKTISHGRDGFIKIWDSAAGTTTAVDTIPSQVFGFCKFSILCKHGFNSTWIAVVTGEQSQVNILELESKQIIHRINPDVGFKIGMCMCLKLFASPSTDRAYLAAGYEDGRVMLWDVTAGKMCSHTVIHSEAVMSMDVDCQSFKVVTGSADDKLAVTSVTPEFDLTASKEAQLKNPGIASVRLRHDSKIVATGGWDGRIRVYGWKKLQPLAYLNYHTSTVNCLDFSDDLPNTGQLMAACSKDSRISLWSIYNDLQR